MPNWPAVKLGDMIVGVDVHAVAPIPGIPVHPYFGSIFLWHSPKFPMANVLINGMPACAVGAMGYSAHIPQGVPVPPTPTNMPGYWKRYLMNIPMALGLMTLTILANIAIAMIATFIPKPPAAERFLKDVTGIDTTNTATTLNTISASFQALTKWQTWVKLLIPPIPYPGAQGSTAVGSPNVTVNGAPLAFVAPLMATSCSDIPVVPNAMTLGFSNVLVGVSIADMVRGLAVSMTQAGIQAGIQAGVTRLQDRPSSGHHHPG
jgi:uncharacterized Zn-binding protein involved in type VI secretion